MIIFTNLGAINMEEREIIELNNGIKFLIYKERDIQIKNKLIADFETIINPSSSSKIKKTSLENLINYFSHLSTWEEEIVTYLVNLLAFN